MILSLSLENWKSHSSSTFSFGKGTNVLVGRMGSGKSSVLDALCFALYGTFPKMSRHDQTTETVVNLNSGAEYATVRLAFERGGKRYDIVRRIGKKLSEAEISCEGKLAQKGAKQVTDHVTETLGVDYELFTRAIYSEQNRMDHILSLSPRARKQEIDWLLGLGDFDTAREAAQSASGKLSEQAELLARQADPAKIEGIGARLSEQKKHENEKMEACERLKKRYDGLSSAINEKAAEFSMLEKTRMEFGRRKRECDLLFGAVQRLARETEGKMRVSQVELEKFSSEKKALEKGVLDSKTAAKKAQESLQAAKSEIAVLQNTKKIAAERSRRLSEIEAKALSLSGGRSTDSFDADISKLKSEAEKIAAERAALIAEMGSLEEAASRLSESGAKCPVCDSDISHGRSEELAGMKKTRALELRKAAEGHAATLAQGKAIISALEAKLSEIRLCGAQIERLKSEASESPGIEGRLAYAQERLAAGVEAAKKSDSGITLLERQLDAAKQKYDEAVRSERLFSDYDSARERQKVAEEALAALYFDEAGYEAFRKAHEALMVEHASAKSDLAGEEKQLTLISELSAVLSDELGKMKGVATLSGEYSQAAQSMAIFKNSLVAAQSELRATLVEEINEALLEIWPSVYPYADYDSVKLEADEKDYRLLMNKEGWKEVDSIASGGERACMCLALRIAFATVLTPDVSWLILDEPTHNLDSDAVVLLSQAINEKIPTIVEQTFVITHEPALGETADGKVFRLDRDKKTGEPSKVEPLG